MSLKKGEFALSEDVDVRVWLDCRAYNQLPPLPRVHNNCFVVMDEDLMTEFEKFKKSFRPNSANPISWIEVNELIEYWMR